MKDFSSSSLLSQLFEHFSPYRRSIFRYLIIGMVCSSLKKCQCFGQESEVFGIFSQASILYSQLRTIQTSKKKINLFSTRLASGQISNFCYSDTQCSMPQVFEVILLHVQSLPYSQFVLTADRFPSGVWLKSSSNKPFKLQRIML